MKKYMMAAAYTAMTLLSTVICLAQNPSTGTGSGAAPMVMLIVLGLAVVGGGVLFFMSRKK